MVFLLVSDAHGLPLTRAEIGCTFEPELNRTFYTGVAFASFGAVTVNTFAASGGVALGVLNNAFDMKIFAKAEYRLPIKLPLIFSFHYTYNGLPDYKTHIQSLLPMVALKGRWVGTAIGPAWHFTIFKQEPVIIEPIFAFSAYVNLYNTEKGRIGLECANYTDFVSRNMGSYSFRLYTSIRITPICTFINDLTLYQTGSVGLAAQLYGIAYRGGIAFTW
jgi:hypothetical protein